MLSASLKPYLIERKYSCKLWPWCAPYVHKLALRGTDIISISTFTGRRKFIAARERSILKQYFWRWRETKLFSFLFVALSNATKLPCWQVANCHFTIVKIPFSTKRNEFPRRGMNFFIWLIQEKNSFIKIVKNVTRYK